MRISIDTHIIDTLMRDLVNHDRAPSSFILYLFLWRQTRGEGRDNFGASLQELATETGLSKSSVQNALRRLKRRGLVSAKTQGPTSACFYQAHEPWRRMSR
jgi:DNA-binding MarR family transcriptional regulator